MLLVVFFISISTVGAEPVRRLKIGVSTDLTGAGASYGQDVRDALLFAAERISPGRYELIIEDDRCSPKDAVSIAQKFVNVDHVAAVIGPACSGSVLAAAPVYEKNKTVAMVTNASAGKIAHAGDYIFRTAPSDPALSRLIFDYMAAHQKKLGLLSEQTDYAQGVKADLMALNQPARLPLVTADYLSETSDFRPFLLKLKAAGADSLYINSQGEQSFSVVLRQLRELHWPVQIYGAYWPGSPELLKVAAAEAEGVIFGDSSAWTSLFTAEGKQVFQDFLKDYKVRCTEIVFAATYEGFRALDAALNSGMDPRTFLYAHKFQGIFGEYRFDANGDLVGLPFVLKRIEGGRPVEILAEQ